jgi:hypothetical protein
LILAKAGSATEAIVPLVEGEILVKFEDDGGRQSTNETSVIVDFPDALGQYLVKSQREDQQHHHSKAQRLILSIAQTLPAWCCKALACSMQL